MKCFFIWIVLGISTTLGCRSQQLTRVGDGCTGCEAIFETPIPFEQLKPVDTLPDYNSPGPKIVISGVIYHADGRTPAKNVVLYVYHTDQTGRYPATGN